MSLLAKGLFLDVLHEGACRNDVEANISDAASNLFLPRMFQDRRQDWAPTTIFEGILPRILIGTGIVIHEFDVLGEN